MFSKTRQMLKQSVQILRGLLVHDSWQQLETCDILLVRHDNDCGFTYKGLVYAQLADSFGDLCKMHGLSVGSVATPFSHRVGKRAYNEPVSYAQSAILIDFKGKCVKVLKGSRVGTDWAESQHVELRHRILKKAMPQCIIGIQPDEYLCRAGKLMDIPVFDLQHGIISDTDPYYGERFRSATPPEKLPDGFLCWDDQSNEMVASWAEKKQIRVITIGNPWFLRFLLARPEDALVNEALSQKIRIDDTRSCILVTLQWDLGVRNPQQVPNGVMVDALEKVILDTDKKYHWIIRLHPIQLHGGDRDIVLRYLNSVFGTLKTQFWVMASDIPMPVILRTVDLHITYESAVVTEAAWMGVRSGILSEQVGPDGKHQNFFTLERSLGMAEVLPHDPETIKKWIAATLSKGRGESTLKASGNLDDFIKNIKRRNS